MGWDVYAHTSCSFHKLSQHLPYAPSSASSSGYFLFILWEDHIPAILNKMHDLKLLSDLLVDRIIVRYGRGHVHINWWVLTATTQDQTWAMIHALSVIEPDTPRWLKCPWVTVSDHWVVASWAMWHGLKTLQGHELMVFTALKVQPETY